MMGGGKTKNFQERKEMKTSAGGQVEENIES